MTSREQLQQMADQAAQRAGVDPALFRALIQQESSWNPRAVSSKGAQGLGQLRPGTAKALGVSNPFDPAQNLDASARYLRQQIDHFGDENLGLAAYNSGPNAVAKAGGVPKFRETQNYIQTIQQHRGSVAPGQGGFLQAVFGSSPETAPAPPPGNLSNHPKLQGLQPGLQGAVSAAMDALQNQGIDLGSLITSGYRDTAKQAQLYDNYIHGRSALPAAPPGTSKHERGLAVDISIRGLAPEQQQVVESALSRAGLYRPMPNKDPVHWQLRGEGVAPTSQAAVKGGGFLDAVFGGETQAAPVSAPPASPAKTFLDHVF